MNTIKELVAAAGNINEKLVRGVVRQFGGKEAFFENADDVSRHGIGGGYSGFIYYVETVAFFRKYKDEIVELAENVANDIGDNVIEMITSFNCIKGEYTGSDVGKALYGRYDSNYDTLYNALAWFAGEEVCRIASDL